MFNMIRLRVSLSSHKTPKRGVHDYVNNYKTQ